MRRPLRCLGGSLLIASTDKNRCEIIYFWTQKIQSNVLWKLEEMPRRSTLAAAYNVTDSAASGKLIHLPHENVRSSTAVVEVDVDAIESQLGRRVEVEAVPLRKVNEERRGEKGRGRRSGRKKT